MRDGFCGRCGHRLETELCGFCLVEVLGVHIRPQVISAESLAGFLRAVFVKHWTLRRPLLQRSA